MRLIRTAAIGFVVLLALGPAKSRAQERSARGWVGVVITTGIGQSNSAGAMVFNDYPVIESIDPGSPAERAGLQAGDMVISLNSQDLRKNPIPDQGMLVPGQKIIFRYRRNDVTKTSTLLVAERPFGTSGHYAFSLIGPPPTRAPRSPGAQTEVAIRERVAARDRGLMPLATIPMIFGTGTPSIGVAGAELTQLNDGLREVLNVKGEGVFVINVAIGTPAGEAGLKSGDVIIRANREALRNPGELIRMMRGAEASHLLLHILRKHKPHTITLRW